MISNCHRRLLFLTAIIVPLTDAADKHVTEESSAINFFAIGDWGGVGSLPGDIHVQQRKVAAGMAQVAKEVQPDFIVSLGDNFYYRGIKGGRSFDRVVHTFENVYSDPSLVSVPWYIIAGNHDYYGNVTEQVRYTYYSRERNTTDPNHIHRWEYPSLYHKKSFRKGNVTVDLILIDTIDLASLSPSSSSDKRKDFKMLKYLVDLPLRSKRKAADDGKQWKWIETSLQQSTADFILVGGHYPVFSQGMHGPTETLIQHLRPLLDKYGAHYLAGHEHSMMHFRDEGDSRANYIVTGTGNACCGARRNRFQKKHELLHGSVPLRWHLFKSDKRKRKEYKDVKGGFVSFRATTESLRVQYRDHQGKVLYEPEQIQPIRRTGKITFPISGDGNVGAPSFSDAE